MKSQTVKTTIINIAEMVVKRVLSLLEEEDKQESIQKIFTYFVINMSYADCFLAALKQKFSYTEASSLFPPPEILG